MYRDFKGYPLSGWATFKQYSENGVYITKGEKGLPVLFWNLEYVLIDNPKERIPYDDWVLLPEGEKELYKQRISYREYTVFNVEQTSMKTEKPELYEKIAARFEVAKQADDSGMYVNEFLDRMVLDQSFICPIKVINSDKAFYSVTWNSITVPLKSQFTDGESFYGVMAHECGHATKAPLKREARGRFGDAAYAREELVAEISAALTGMQLGFSTTIENHNAQYLKNWESALKDEDKKSKTFLYEVVKDAVKASEITVSCATKNAALVA
jgi:antirestriction protein ArdC